jgi:hypothetical protein
MANASLEPDTLRRMRDLIRNAIAARSMPVAEAAAEARGLAHGIQPRAPRGAVLDAVAGILRDLGAYEPPPAAPLLLTNEPLRPASREEVADALAFAMRFNEHGKARRTGWEYAAQLAADQLVSGLERAGFVLMRGPGTPRHDAYPRSAPDR